MAYRIETNKTTEEMVLNFQKFLLNPITIDRVDYSSSVGNGNIESIDFNSSTVVTESWTLQCTDDTNFVFSVTGSVSGSQADAQLDTPYDNGIISFTIRQGSQTWVAGDIVVIYVQKGSTPPWEKLTKYSRVYYEKAFVSGNTNFSLRLQPGVTTEGIIPPSKSLGAFRAMADKEINDSNNNYYTEYNSLMIDEFYDSESTYCRITSTGENAYIDANTDLSINIWVKSLTERHYMLPSSYGYYEYTHDGCFVLPPSARRYSNGERGFGLHIGGGALRVIKCRNDDHGYYYKYEHLLESQFSDKFLDMVTDPNDWNMLTFTLDRATNKLKVYVNAVEMGEYSHGYLQTLFSPGIVSWYGEIAGYAVWDRKLSPGEITNAYNDRSYDNIMAGMVVSMGGVGAVQADIILKLKNKKYGFSNISMSSRHMIGAGYRASEQFQYLNLQDLPTTNATFEQDSFSIGTTNRWSGNAMYNNSNDVYTIGRDPGEVIEKYWFVTDGVSAVLAFKIYDPSTTQTEPVYQMLYFGETEGTKYFELPVYIGTRNGYDNWTTTSGAFRFGLQYAYNLVAFCGYFKRNTSSYAYRKFEWFDNRSYVYSGGLFYKGQPSYWSKVKSINNQYPLTKIPIFLEWYNGTTSSDYGMYQPFGYVKFIYQAVTDNIQAEDEIIIDGTKYVILKDTYRTSSDSMYALKLED